MSQRRRRMSGLIVVEDGMLLFGHAAFSNSG
jgi:hypothetical protein